MCVNLEARKYFGVFQQNDGQNVVTNAVDYANDNVSMHKELKELNSLNIEKAILKNEVSFIFKFLLIVDCHRRGDLYAREFPLHKPSPYISKYYEVVEAKIDLFSKASEIIHNYRFGKNVYIGDFDHPIIQKKILEFVAEIKEPLLSILEKLKAAFQETDFKKEIKAEQKYFSKMKIKYSEFAQELIDSSKKFSMIEFDLHTRDFSFDHYTSGSICTVNFDAILDDLGSDRELFIDLTRKEFLEDFIGCIWKLNHNLSRGFYLSFLFFMKNSRNVKMMDRLENYLTNSVYNNKKYQLIRSGSWLKSYSPNSEYVLSSVSKYVMMDSIFNLKIEGHKTLGRVGFKSIATQHDLIG